MVSAIVGAFTKKSVCSFGNLNGYVGTAITLLRVTSTTQLAVLEVGIDAPKAMASHMKMIKPDLAILTNIGLEHLNKLKNLKTVADEELEVFKAVDERGGTLIVNLDDRIIAKRHEAYSRARKIFYSLSASAPVRGCVRGRVVRPGLVQIKFPDRRSMNLWSLMHGTQNAQNLVAAVAFGYALNIPSATIRAGLARFRPPPFRSEMHRHGSCEIIADLYNAHPSSMRASLSDFSSSKTRKKKIAILGDMLDLGRQTISEHQKLATALRATRAHQVLLVGPAMKHAHARGTGRNSLHFANKKELIRHLSNADLANSQILIKGSRAMALEEVMEFVKSVKAPK